MQQSFIFFDCQVFRTKDEGEEEDKETLKSRMMRREGERKKPEVMAGKATRLTGTEERAENVCESRDNYAKGGNDSKKGRKEICIYKFIFILSTSGRFRKWRNRQWWAPLECILHFLKKIIILQKKAWRTQFEQLAVSACARTFTITYR